ncbi:MAG: DUF4011 domain-containing protein [Clostridia bacterium]|nr:DUF4011 domain-containing protein [Clostridia bacterium]
MNKISENIEAFTIDLLHINDISSNKLIDLYAGDLSKTFFISHPTRDNLSKYVLEIISARIGKVGNTVLLQSAIANKSEQILGKDINDLAWQDAKGNTDAVALHKYIENVYKELDLRGNNPLFFSVGAITWKVASKEYSIKEVTSPLLLFPIKFIRSTSKTTPIYIEFVCDDIYINPCFLAVLRQMAGDKIVEDFPHPNQSVCDVDCPINIDYLGNGEAYFAKVEEYVSSQCRSDISSDTTFKFDKNIVAISQYNHDELCMYYDIKRNKEKIYSHPLINRIFSKGEPYQEVDYSKTIPQFIMPRDSVQERIVKRVVAGQSLIVKGPPGTGKTVTITNLIASLLAQNKKILLSSQKSAAMFEVYAKLPPSIRKFVMLLDSETEAQASKLNVVDVKKEFNQLLSDRKNHTFSADKYDDYECGNREIASTIATIKNYRELMFDNKDVVGRSYYSALDTICKYDIDPILFMNSNDACNMTSKEFSYYANLVNEAGEWLDKAALDHELIKSPWYPINGSLDGVEIEKVVEYNGKLSNAISELVAECEGVEGLQSKWYKNISISVLDCVLEQPLDEGLLKTVSNIDNVELLKSVCTVYEEYLATQSASTEISNPPAEAIEKYAKELGLCRIDGDLKKSQFLTFYDNSNVIELLSGKSQLEAITSAINFVEDIEVKKKECLDEFYSIFSPDISKENLSLIECSFKIFNAYAKKEDCIKPKLLDFKTKKAYAILNKLGYGEEISFKDVVKGVCLFNNVINLDKNLDGLKAKLSSQFKIKLNAQQIEALFKFVDSCKKSELDIANCVKDFIDCKDTIFNAIKECNSDVDFTIKDLLKTYLKTGAFENLAAETQRFADANNILIEGNSVESFAKAVYGTSKIFESSAVGNTIEEVLRNGGIIYNAKNKLKPLLFKIKALLLEFEKNCFASFYTVKNEKCLLKELELIVKEGQDRSVCNALCQYFKVVKCSHEACSLERFFRPFETGLREKGKYSYKSIFEFSVNWLAVENKKNSMGELRNGLRDKISYELNDWKNAISQIDKATLSIIEDQCMAKINYNDQDFNFLKAEKQGGQSLRRFFKENAKAILKLKKCFILSPSTASVFFTKEEFNDFDIVIVDEASQLEPTSILPVLFRAKQVVLIGDEWQMPPIKHFANRVEKRIVDSEGEVKILSPNTSVLGLALDNCAFPVEQFICHYRSKAESLIAFSQEKFYPNMRTFPARVPKAEGLGFKDIYVPDGCCDGGVNEKEAIAVVKQLKLHFDTYYDESTKSLNGSSVGVVAFGKEQKDYIESLVAKDTDLASKIQKAIENFGDLPEKLIFFKTIESVQGQEVEHLILSLTYGKNKEGKVVQSFGELNRGFNEDKLGQCIFNVAVTRAKSSIAVIHSILAEEIKLESIDFIGKYLSIVNKFGSDDNREQWVGKKVDETTGFIRQVANFIIESGVDEKRIVIDYGVNPTSIKIPIVILSADLTEAELGLWCETEVLENSNYFDINVRYVDSLVDRGWNIHKIFIHDWVDNSKSEKEALKKILKKYVNIENSEV